MPDDKPRAALPVVAGARVPAAQSPTPPAWPIRPAPSALPLVDQGWGARRRTLAFARNVDAATTAADAARRFYAAAEAAEAAHQSAEAQHEKRRAVPIIAATERAGLQTAHTQAVAQLDAAQHEHEARTADHHNRQYVASLEWQKIALALQAEIGQASAAIDAIRDAGAAGRARSEREQQIAAEGHRIEMLKRDLIALDLIAEVRARLDALRKARQEGGADTVPESFKRHYGMAQEVQRNRSEAQQRIDAIYLKAAAERRQLTDSELQEIDALADAAEAAEAEVRRSAASDLK